MSVQSRYLMKSRHFSLKKRIVFEERCRRGDATIFGLTSFRDGEDFSGETFPLSLLLMPFIHWTAAGYFRGFYFAWSNETHASVISVTREKSIFTPTIKSVSRLQKSPQKTNPRQWYKNESKDNREKKGERGIISVCTLHYSSSRSLKWRRRYYEKKLTLGKQSRSFQDKNILHERIILD